MEGFRVELRGEAFNALNQVNFANPATNIDSASCVVASPALYPALAGACTSGEAFRRAFQYKAAPWGEHFRERVNWAKTADRTSYGTWGQALPATVLHGDGNLHLPRSSAQYDR